jgi:excisionase family DNA binding protein
MCAKWCMQFPLPLLYELEGQDRSSNQSNSKGEPIMQSIDKLGYSKADAAQATFLSKRTIDYLIQRGVLKATKIGKRVVIPRKALEALISHGAGVNPGLEDK